jgi:amino acid transporter
MLKRNKNLIGIGTGIFDGATTILREDQNVGWTLVLWAVGAVASFAGALMYIEYGLTIPRVFIQGRERSVPRR